MQTLVGILDSVGSIALAVLGISFLIFIHEGGHFLAARLFGVRVETFSIGFGPRVFGMRRGETDYRLSIIPLGGYVKMAGEYGDYDDDTVLADDDLNAKPAWQRAIIFAGGVIVNFLFAFIAFPIVFAMGLPATAPVIGSMTPGGAAWQAGLQPGDEILSIDGRKIYDFGDLRLESALADDTGMRATILRDGREFELGLRPLRNEDEDRFELGIEPAVSDEILVEPGGPAETAGLADGDRLIMLGNAAPSPDGRALLRALASLRDESPLPVTYLRDGQRLETTITPRHETELTARPMLGVLRGSGRVVALRGEAALDGTLPLRRNDVILSVDGRPVTQVDEIEQALRDVTGDTAVLSVLRQGDERRVVLGPAHRHSLLAGEIALGLELDGARIGVQADGAAADAGMRSGDEIRSIDGVTVHRYMDLAETVATGESKRHSIRFWRPVDDREQTVVVETRTPDYFTAGLRPRFEQVRHKVGLGGAIVAGFETSINSLRTTWLTLVRLISGEVGSKNISGIVGIGQVTYQYAHTEFSRLLFFLALLSINLGFINILPIPVLDGGQMLFLLFEKIKGSRLSERFLNTAQITGLLAILLLVVYVTYNDIQRIIQ